MNKKRLSWLISGLFIFSSNTLLAYPESFTYGGLDFLMNRTTLKKGHGGHFFYNSTAPQYNFFIGRFINEGVGFELGYEDTVNKKHSSVAQVGQEAFGIQNYSGAVSNAYQGHKKIRALNLNVMPRFDIGDSMIIVPVFGLSYFETTFNLFVQNVGGAEATAADKTDLDVKFQAKKIVPRAGLRLHFDLVEHLGARVFVLWENTQRLNPTGRRNRDYTQPLTIRMKNAVSLGFGLYYHL